MTETEVAKTKPHVTHYTVNDEPQETTERELTPRQIMGNAGIDPADNYLVEIVGKNQKSFQDTPDKPIHIHEKQAFATIFTGTVPVS